MQNRKLRLQMSQHDELPFVYRGKNIVCKFSFRSDDSEPIASIEVSTTIEGKQASNIFDKKEGGWGLREQNLKHGPDEKFSDIPEEIRDQIITLLNDTYPD